MELIIVRHGLPVRIEGADAPADPSLTDLGKAQAEAMAAWLGQEPLDAVYVSPMARARQTAEPLCRVLGYDPIVVDGIAEYDRDEHSYVPIEELKAENSEGWARLIASGTSDERRTWREGIVAEFEAIIDANRGRRIAAVCHGGVINAYVSHVVGIDSAQFFEPFYTGANRIMAASSGERTVVTINESHWLRELGGPNARADSWNPPQ